MEEYNKIIESLGIKFIKAASFEVSKPINVRNFYEIDNILILLHKGEIYFAEDNARLYEGEILFIPASKLLSVTYGEPEQTKNIDNEEFVSNHDAYFTTIPDIEQIDKYENSFTVINFSAKIFDSVNFFSSLDIPPFKISKNNELRKLIKDVDREHIQQKPGSERMLKVNTEKIVIEIFRYILDCGLFVEQLATNSNYFKDPRLINIFAYIKQNLGGDLSNQKLAEVAGVSEDYVGQYFKMLTGINPQDYIEYQRMEMAVNLLRTTKDSIRDIGYQIGYKDTAYFCRRFKMMFGIPAGKMRRRESLMNVS